MAGDRLIEILPQLNEEQCPWEKREAVPKTFWGGVT
jgi:hypothetical protein